MNFHFSHFVQSFGVFSVKTPGVKAAVVKQRLTVGSGTRDLESPRNTNQLSISSLFSVCRIQFVHDLDCINFKFLLNGGR